MKLVLWTADKAAALQKVVAQQIAAAGVDHRVEPFVDDALPVFEEGEVVLCMGTKCLGVLQAVGLVQKGRTIGSVRFPTKVMLGKAEGLITYAAGTVDRDYELSVELLVDLSVAIRRIVTGSYAPKLGEYRWVNDFSDAKEYITAQVNKTGKQVEVAMDLETLGLNPYAKEAHIVSVQFSYRPGFSDVVHLPTKADEQMALSDNHELWFQLDWLLNSKQVSLRGANLKYDLIWLWVRSKLTCANFKLDTMIVGSLLDENRGNSLNLHTKLYAPELGGYDDEFNKKYDKSRMDLVPLPDLLNYAGGDTDACLRVSQKMKTQLLQNEPLAKFYVNLLHPAVRAYEHVEKTGICVDVPYYLELEHELKQDIAKLEKEAFKLMGGRICIKYSDNLTLSRSAILKEFMFGPLGLNLTPKLLTPKSKEPSTAIEHLLSFADDPKAKAFVDVLAEWSSYSKAKNTYVCTRDKEGKIVKGFLAHLRDDGRFHPNYYLFNGYEDDSGDEDEGGTNTGRLSAKRPAIQTIPKHKPYAKKLRRAFIAPPGMVFMSHDYSQGELKIAACLANEQAMIHAYSQGIDLHAVTASRIAGYSWYDFEILRVTNLEKYEAIRQLGKAGNFGLLYGMGVEGFQRYAYALFKVVLTYEEAEHARAVFFSTYPGLSLWHKKCKDTARSNGQIVSPLGRVRHLPLIYSPNKEVSSKAERQAINAPVQTTLSDISLWATSIFWKNGWLDVSPVVAMVHDQLLSYVPEDDWQFYENRNRQVMENLPFGVLGWEPQLKFTVDTEIGPNLAEMKKKKGSDLVVSS